MLAFVGGSCHGVGVDAFRTGERVALRESVRRFVAGDIAPYLDQWEQDGELPRELHVKAGALGLLGVG
ncbi:acyl-CoA dehydrogenase family protein, partial [Kibdelosporangium lantanae]